MASISTRNRVLAGVGLSVLIFGLAGSALAQSSPDVERAGQGTDAPAPQVTRLSPEEVAAFKADPASLIVKYSLTGETAAERFKAGNAVADYVRDLVVTDFTTSDDLLVLARDHADYRFAIGTGLSRAALTLVAIDPDLAGSLQEKVALSGISEVQTAFLSTNFMSSALAGAYGGTGRAGGGSVSSGGGASSNFIENGVPQKGASSPSFSRGSVSYSTTRYGSTDGDTKVVSPTVQN